MTVDQLITKLEKLPRDEEVIFRVGNETTRQFSIERSVYVLEGLPSQVSTAVEVLAANVDICMAVGVFIIPTKEGAPK